MDNNSTQVAGKGPVTNCLNCDKWVAGSGPTICAECTESTEGFVHRIERAVTITGELTDEQRTRLQEIAHKCPVHKTLTSEIVIADLKE